MKLIQNKNDQNSDFAKRKWDEFETILLKKLLLDRKLTNSEIARKLNRSRFSVERKSQQLGLRNTAYIKFTDEFKLLVLEYYKNTDSKEACKKFALSVTQLDGILNSLRRRKIYDPRGIKKNEWATKELILVLRYIGLQPAEIIAPKVGRTTSALNSYLKRKGYYLHYINGLSKDVFYRLFNPSKDIGCIRGRNKELIVPWTFMEEKIEDIMADEVQKVVIKSMAVFQRFIHGAHDNSEMRELLFNIVTE